MNIPDSKLVSVVTSESVLPAVVVVARLLWVLNDVITVMASVESDDVVTVAVGTTTDELEGAKTAEVTPEGILPVVFIADELLLVVNRAKVVIGSETSEDVVTVPVGITL